MSSKIISAQEGVQWTPWALSPLHQLEEAVATTSTSTSEGVSDATTSEYASDSSTVEEDSDPVVVETVEIEPARIYPTAAEIEAIHQEAFQAGFEAGKTAGFEAGHKEGWQAGHTQASTEFNQAYEQFLDIQQRLQVSVTDVDQSIAPALLQLALSCAQKIVASHIQIKQDAVLDVLKQALSTLPDSIQQAKLRLHPDDIEVMKHYLSEERLSQSWQLIPDPALDRGGCLLDSPVLSIDLSLQQRWQALSNALGTGNVSAN